jgi:D-glycero-alpha-D-manno-heptose-7-phosphate kinase
MIISRTPFRISFFGGGTDYPAWYRQRGGSVLSATINKYCYVSTRYLPPFFDYTYRIRYTMREETTTIDQIKHPSVRECLRFMQIAHGIEMVHTSDIPAMSGIGSSSAFTVAFLHSLHALKGKVIAKRHLAGDAVHVEQNLLRENVGSQDQVAAAFGGLNRIDFGGTEDFYVTPMTISREKLVALQDHCMLFFTGFSRIANDVAKEQIKNIPQKEAELKTMHQMVDEAVNIINDGDGRITDFGRLLHESWQLKRGLSCKITTGEIDSMYDTARRAGALGGKLCGAGGGGFLLLFVPPERQASVKDALKKLLYVPFKFEHLGSQIIMFSPEDIYG